MSKSLTQSLNKINKFFENYARAIENFDAKQMASHYALPCLFISDDASVNYTDIARLEGLFNTGISFYKKYGIAHARPEVWSKRSWTDKIVKARVNWQYYDADNQPLYNCDYQYILKRDKHNKWKIEVSISINEKDRIEEWEQDRQSAVNG